MQRSFTYIHTSNENVERAAIASSTGTAMEIYLHWALRFCQNMKIENPETINEQYAAVALQFEWSNPGIR